MNRAFGAALAAGKIIVRDITQWIDGRV